MASFDYWRLPALEASPEPTDDEEPPGSRPTHEEAVEKGAAGAAPAGPSRGSEGVAVAPGAGAARRPPRWVLAPGQGEHGPAGAEPVLEELEEVIGLDEGRVGESSYPVRLMALPSYIRLLQQVEDGAPAPGTVSLRQESPMPPTAVPRVCVAARLAEECGADSLPPELLQPGDGDGQGAWPARSAQLHGDGAELARWDAGAAPAGPRPAPLWRALHDGSVAAPDPVLCGKLRPVPALPNPFVVLGDAPALVEEMLADVPEEARDAKASQPPATVEGLPGLCRGPGGLLPGHTPRQLARNLLAAALLNRLSANVLTACAGCAAALRAAGPGALPEERALAAAQSALREAQEGEALSRREEAEAAAELRAFRGGGRPDAERERHLEGMLGWKGSVRAQLEAELAEAGRALSAAEAALAAARRQRRRAPWHERWPGPAPEEAAAEPFFRVRLAAGSPELLTVRDFAEAMQLGLIDRSGSGFVTKHALEAAFVSHLADGLLLCARGGRGPGAPEAPAGPEAREAYTHIPAPAALGTGLVEPGGGRQLRALRPHHELLLRMEGQTFPFAVVFGAFPGRRAGFVGLGAHALTYATPWNPLHYGDVLWAREAQQGLTLVPVLATVGALVLDPERCLGPFPPLGRAHDGEVPLGAGGLAVLQAALFNDVKMWPVALPAAARARWGFALRALRQLLQRHREAGELGSSPATDAVLDEALPQLLEALAKVPDDGAGACGGGVGDRLKRMELSALAAAPLRGAARLAGALDELGELWRGFEGEGAAP